MCIFVVMLLGLKDFWESFTGRVRDIIRFIKNFIGENDTSKTLIMTDQIPTPLVYSIKDDDFDISDDFQRRYCEYIKKEHHLLTDIGLQTRGHQPLALNQVFIEMSLAAISPNQAQINIIRNRERKTDAYSIQKCLHEDPQNALVILGPPGSGKTTLLKYLISAILEDAQKDNACLKDFPILLFLREQVDNIKRGLSLANLLQQHFSDDTHYPDLHPPQDWFAARLKHIECLLLLDGFDEVVELEDRKILAAWIERQINAYPQCRIVLTSRPEEYLDSQFGRGHVMELLPFSAEQASEFIEKWYNTNEIESDDIEKQPCKADELWQRLKDHQQLRYLYGNPLLLKMIVLVNEYRGKLPDTRGELYEEICSVLLENWPQSKGIESHFSGKEKREVLEFLAFEMMERETRYLLESEVMSVLQKIPDNLNIPKDLMSDKDLLNDIVNFLIGMPRIRNIADREAFIINAGFDESLKNQLDFSGTTSQFIPLLIEAAYKYGGISPISDLLQEACENVGSDKQQIGEKLIEKLSSKRLHQQENVFEIIHEIERGSGLFIHQDKQDIWEFAHSNFKEYLCASYWKHHAHAEKWERAEWQRFFNEDNHRWDETLYLYAAQKGVNRSQLFDIWLECQISAANQKLLVNIAEETLPRENRLWKRINPLNRAVYLRDYPITTKNIEELDEKQSDSYYRFEPAGGQCGDSVFFRPSQLKLIQHQYEAFDNVIFDRATGLVWEQSGSKERMTYEKASEYLQKLNEAYHDYSTNHYNAWRLPTIPELLSLLHAEKAESNDLYVNTLFDRMQKSCWSTDKRSEGYVWECFFVDGYIHSVHCEETSYVRAVRSYSGSST